MAFDDHFFGYVIVLAGNHRAVVVVYERLVVHSPHDCLVELCIAFDARDHKLVLKRKIALVYNAQSRKLVGAAGFPKNFSAFGRDLSVNLELQGFAFGIYPSASVVFILHFNVQRSCLNLVYGSACSIRKPSERRADEQR